MKDENDIKDFFSSLDQQLLYPLTQEPLKSPTTLQPNSIYTPQPNLTTHANEIQSPTKDSKDHQNMTTFLRKI